MYRLFIVFVFLLVLPGLTACDGADQSSDGNDTKESVTPGESAEANEPTAGEDSNAFGEPGSVLREGAAQIDDGRHVEPGAFSYIPPEGWNIETMPGMRYKLAMGPEINGETANINVVEERYPGPIDDYVEASLNSIEVMLQEFELDHRGSITTDTGEVSPWLEFRHLQFGQTYRQRMYFFAAADNMYYLMTCTIHSVHHDKDVFFPRCDNAAKSFRAGDAGPAPDASRRGFITDEGRFKIPELVSYEVPEGWVADEAPGSEYLATFAPEHDGFRSNLVVVKEDSELDLEEYTRVSYRELIDELGVDIIDDPAPLTTASGVEGRRLEFTHDVFHIPLRQVFYVYDGGPYYVLLVCSAHDSQAELMLPTCDAAAKTVQIDS